MPPLYAVKKAAETVHVQLNEANGAIEVVNNKPASLSHLSVRSSVYGFDGKLNGVNTYAVAQVPGSTTIKAAQIDVSSRISPLISSSLDLLDGDGQLLSTNFYWQNVAQDDFTG